MKGTSTEHYQEAIATMLTHPTFSFAAHHLVLAAQHLDESDFQEIAQQTGVPPQRMIDALKWVSATVRETKS